MNNKEKKLREIIKEGNPDWNYISEHNKLSEDFIREFQCKVNWNFISKYQKLSRKFIEEFKDVINMNFMSAYNIRKYLKIS
jgi:hypothetical protein